MLMNYTRTGKAFWNRTSHFPHTSIALTSACVVFNMVWYLFEQCAGDA